MPDVSSQIFERFLEALKSSGLSDDLTTRLRKTLLADKSFTEKSLKAAILAEEPAP